jgi:hypothetical protein
MPKGRGANARRRGQRQRQAAWISEHGEPMRAHHERMMRATGGRGPKGPCMYGHPAHQSSAPGRVRRPSWWSRIRDFFANLRLPSRNVAKITRPPDARLPGPARALKRQRAGDNPGERLVSHRRV